MHQAVQRVLLRSYRLVFARGLLRFTWGRRLFYGLYESYKWLFEARSIGGLQAFVPRGSCVDDVELDRVLARRGYTDVLFLPAGFRAKMAP